MENGMVKKNECLNINSLAEIELKQWITERGIQFFLNH